MAGKLDVATTSAEVTIKKESIVGSGAYGVVYLAKWNELTCAAKIIHDNLSTFHVPGKPSVATQFEEECTKIKEFRHPNIVQFLGTIRDPDNMFPVLLMELMEKSLTALLEETTEPLTYCRQISICHNVSLAITYLHSAGFIHRDISSNNVLMKGDTAKLTDLGVSVLINSCAPSRQTTCPGTEVYMPPDSVKERPNYTEKIDCFSFGVLGVQILTRRFPQPGERYSAVTILQEASNGTPMELLRVVPEVERRKSHLDLISPTHPLFELLRKCLKDKEPDRPSAVEICRYVAHLRDIEEYEVKQRSRSSSTSSNATGAEATAPKANPTVSLLESSMESRQSRVEQLLSDNEQLRETISGLEREKAALSLFQVQQEPSRGILGWLRGGRRQEDQVRALQARIQEQDRELEEKRKTKKNHLEKWDWLEKEYQKQCRATRCAQQNLKRVEDELKASNEMCTLKDQRIEELENESAAEKLASNRDEASLVEEISEDMCRPLSLDLSDHFGESTATESGCVLTEESQVESTDEVCEKSSAKDDTKRESGSQEGSEAASCDDVTSADHPTVSPEISKADLFAMIKALQKEVSELKDGPPKAAHRLRCASDVDQNGFEDEVGSPLTLLLDTKPISSSEEQHEKVMAEEQPVEHRELGVAHMPVTQKNEATRLAHVESVTPTEQPTEQEETAGASSKQTHGYQVHPTKQLQWGMQYREHQSTQTGEVTENELAATKPGPAGIHGNRSGVQPVKQDAFTQSLPLTADENNVSFQQMQPGLQDAARTAVEVRPVSGIQQSHLEQHQMPSTPSNQPSSGLFSHDQSAQAAAVTPHQGQPVSEVRQTQAHHGPVSPGQLSGGENALPGRVPDQRTSLFQPGPEAAAPNQGWSSFGTQQSQATTHQQPASLPSGQNVFPPTNGGAASFQTVPLAVAPKQGWPTLGTQQTQATAHQQPVTSGQLSSGQNAFPTTEGVAAVPMAVAPKQGWPAPGTQHTQAAAHQQSSGQNAFPGGTSLAAAPPSQGWPASGTQQTQATAHQQPPSFDQPSSRQNAFPGGTSNQSTSLFQPGPQAAVPPNQGWPGTQQTQATAHQQPASSGQPSSGQNAFPGDQRTSLFQPGPQAAVPPNQGWPGTQQTWATVHQQPASSGQPSSGQNAFPPTEGVAAVPMAVAPKQGWPAPGTQHTQAAAHQQPQPSSGQNAFPGGTSNQRTSLFQPGPQAPNQGWPGTQQTWATAHQQPASSGQPSSGQNAFPPTEGVAATQQTQAAAHQQPPSSGQPSSGQIAFPGGTSNQNISLAAAPPSQGWPAPGTQQTQVTAHQQPPSSDQPSSWQNAFPGGTSNQSTSLFQPGSQAAAPPSQGWPASGTQQTQATAHQQPASSGQPSSGQNAFPGDQRTSLFQPGPQAAVPPNQGWPGTQQTWATVHQQPASSGQPSSGQNAFPPTEGVAATQQTQAAAHQQPPSSGQPSSALPGGTSNQNISLAAAPPSQGWPAPGTQQTQVTAHQQPPSSDQPCSWKNALPGGTSNQNISLAAAPPSQGWPAPGTQQTQVTAHQQPPSSSWQNAFPGGTSNQSTSLFQPGPQAAAPPNQGWPAPGTQQTQVTAHQQPASFNQPSSGLNAFPLREGAASFQAIPEAVASQQGWQGTPYPGPSPGPMLHTASFPGGNTRLLQQQHSQPHFVQWPGEQVPVVGVRPQYWGGPPFGACPLMPVDQNLAYSPQGQPCVQLSADVPYVDSSGNQFRIRRNWTAPVFASPPAMPPSRPQSQTQQIYVVPQPQTFQRPQQYQRSSSHPAESQYLPASVITIPTQVQEHINPAGDPTVEQVLANTLPLGAEASSVQRPEMPRDHDDAHQDSYSTTHANSPVECNDTESIVELMGKQPNTDHSGSYLVALIRQQCINSDTKQWTVIFTVCRQNPCCITPLINLLNKVYGATFHATIFSAKFKEREGENDPSITLNIPVEEARKQGYAVTSTYTPCYIRRSEASGITRKVDHSYPPRCEITIAPLVGFGECCKPLHIPLDLFGTDDKRKFTLTNPSVYTLSPPAVDSPLSPEPRKDHLCSYGPADARDSHIRGLITTTSQIDRSAFGTHLGLSLDDVLRLKDSTDPSTFMLQTFECWFRTVLEPEKKSWRCILTALRESGCSVLASKMEQDLNSPHGH